MSMSNLLSLDLILSVKSFIEFKLPKSSISTSTLWFLLSSIIFCMQLVLFFHLDKLI